jgi:hypothetical protein
MLGETFLRAAQARPATLAYLQLFLQGCKAAATRSFTGNVALRNVVAYADDHGLILMRTVLVCKWYWLQPLDSEPDTVRKHPFH